MAEAPWYGAAFGAGILLGIFYFGGLWMTVRALPHAKHPAFLVLGSYLFRLGLAGVCLALVSRGGQWDRLLFCSLGLLLPRFFLARIAGYSGSVLSAGKENAWKRK